MSLKSHHAIGKTSYFYALAPESQSESSKFNKQELQNFMLLFELHSPAINDEYEISCRVSFEMDNISPMKLSGP